MRAGDYKKDRRVVTTLFLVFVSSFGARVEADTPEGTIWVDMKKPRQETALKKTADALILRLPDWNVVVASKDNTFAQFCRSERSSEGYLVLLSQDNGIERAAMFSCDRDEPLWQDVRLDGDDPAGGYRRYAVLASLVVQRGEGTSSGAETGAGGDGTKIDPGLSETIDRVRGTLALLPGMTVAPRRGDVVFTGRTAGGVLLKNNVGLSLGTQLSTPYRGDAVKNSHNENSATEISISVQEISVRLSAEYILEMTTRWQAAFGVGLSYSFFIKRDLIDGKYAIEEEAPVARGAVSPVVSASYRPFHFLAIVLSTQLQVSFGRRVFSVRGEHTIDLGTITAVVGLGSLFFF